MRLPPPTSKRCTGYRVADASPTRLLALARDRPQGTNAVAKTTIAIDEARPAPEWSCRAGPAGGHDPVDRGQRDGDDHENELDPEQPPVAPVVEGPERHAPLPRQRQAGHQQQR